MEFKISPKKISKIEKKHMKEEEIGNETQREHDVAKWNQVDYVCTF